MKYKKNQDNNFIFECVREKLFLYGFIVATLKFEFYVKNTRIQPKYIQYVHLFVDQTL